jgi:uncharacterized membrane protein YtjA (UPF0391 family)
MYQCLYLAVVPRPVAGVALRLYLEAKYGDGDIPAGSCRQTANRPAPVLQGSGDIGRARTQKGEKRTMLRWALLFLVIALVAGLLGFAGVAGAASNIAWIIFVLFLILFVVSLFMGGRTPA